MLFFYLSTYFEEHKKEYYECLQNVRQKLWGEWIKFFLIGVIKCSNNAIDVMDDLLKLRTAYKTKLIESKAPKSAIALLETILAAPVISIHTAARSWNGISSCKKSCNLFGESWNPSTWRF